MSYDKQQTFAQGYCTTRRKNIQCMWRNKLHIYSKYTFVRGKRVYKIHKPDKVWVTPMLQCRIWSLEVIKSVVPLFDEEDLEPKVVEFLFGWTIVEESRIE